MATFIYRCPSTGMQVQGWLAGDDLPTEETYYESVVCLACRQLHWVNPRTGRTLGADEG